MSFINANIPLIECYIRKEFLFNEEKHEGEFEDVILFGITSLRFRVPLFNTMTRGGGHFCRMPIHAFCHKKNAPKKKLEELIIWNNFSYDIGIIKYDYLSDCKAKVFLRDKKTYIADYLFTMDYAHPQKNYIDFDYSEDPDDHKSANVMKLEDGNFCIAPNNRILWSDTSFIEPYKEIPQWKPNTKIWEVPKNGWKVEGEYFYDIVKKEEHD